MDLLVPISVPGNQSFSFTTKGAVKVIYVSYSHHSNPNQIHTMTNANPTTGEIDNNQLYLVNSGQSTITALTSESYFTVNGNTVSYSKKVSSNSVYVSIMYSYE